MLVFKYRYMTRTLLLIAIVINVLQPVSGARNLDDDPWPTKYLTQPDDSGEISYTRWAYGFFEKWPGAPHPITLKYAFEEYEGIDYLSQNDIENTFARAFATWSSIIQVTFEKADSLSKAHIKIGFFHGDSRSSGLIKALFPPLGRLRLNADVRWALDFNDENYNDAFDLESVAIHAIGHVLGLDHSDSKDAIMYPQISPGIKKVDFEVEDVVLAQKLYGPNPEYHFHHSYRPPQEYHHHQSYRPKYHYESPSPTPVPSQLTSGASSNLQELIISTRHLGFSIVIFLVGLIIMV